MTLQFPASSHPHFPTQQSEVQVTANYLCFPPKYQAPSPIQPFPPGLNTFEEEGQEREEKLPAKGKEAETNAGWYLAGSP